VSVNGKSLLPEVRSVGGPGSHVEIRRQAYRARAALGTPTVRCPAGRLETCESGLGLVVHCGVERSLIGSRADPSTLLNRCLNDPGYQFCTSWRSEKKRIAEGKGPIVGTHEGV
jgi:hypothetical protein